MLQPWVIEEQLKKERTRSWEPEPLHAPTPGMQAPRRHEESETDADRDTEPSTIIIIDIATGDVTRM